MCVLFFLIPISRDHVKFPEQSTFWSKIILSVLLGSKYTTKEVCLDDYYLSSKWRPFYHLNMSPFRQGNYSAQISWTYLLIFEKNIDPD